jgi:Zn-dependent protease with chaperone function
MTIEADAAGPAADDWQAFSSTERESFFAAIARHRRAAWRVTLVSWIGILLAGLVIAILTAPLFYAVIGLSLDLVNLFIPMPNLLGDLVDYMGALQDSPDPVPVGAWVRIGFYAALPGALWIAVIVTVLRRMLLVAAKFDHAELHARPPDATVLAEQRFANVVEEMAIAANLPAPRVFVARAASQDAAVMGADERHATIVVTEGLLARFNRDEMQGVAAHLVGSIANGDMTIGMRAALALGFFATMARLASIMSNDNSGPGLRRMLVAMSMPTVNNARKFAAELADPFAPDDTPADKPAASVPSGNTSNTLTWRQWLMFPLYGPLVMTGFFGGVASQFVLGSMISFAWRQRKYMADATAVQLTRDPDTLGRALEKLSAAGSGTLARWANHLGIAHSGHAKSFMGAMVPMFPSLDRRLAALRKLGATLTRAPKQPIPLKTLLIIVPLLSIAGVLMIVLLPLLAYVSAALSMLFTGLPVGIVHVLLRWIGD